MKADDYGLTTICNIYFDTDSYDLIRNSIEKPIYKEKIRLRSYGVPDESSRVFLEIKKKHNGIVYKRRIGITYGEALRYIEQGIPPSNDGQIFREIDYFMHFYNPVPKLYLAYDRIAMCGIEDTSFRMTFDFNIRSRQDRLGLSYGDDGTLLFENSNVVMEIKAAGAVPIWLAKILSELEIYKTLFSKYGQIYKKNIIGKEYIICSEAFSTPQQV